MQSGSALNPWSITRTDVEGIAKILGLSSADEREVLKKLQEVPVSEVLNVQEKLKDVMLINRQS